MYCYVRKWEEGHTVVLITCEHTFCCNAQKFKMKDMQNKIKVCCKVHVQGVGLEVWEHFIKSISQIVSLRCYCMVHGHISQEKPHNSVGLAEQQKTHSSFEIWEGWVVFVCLKKGSLWKSRHREHINQSIVNVHFGLLESMFQKMNYLQLMWNNVNIDLNWRAS